MRSSDRLSCEHTIVIGQIALGLARAHFFLGNWGRGGVGVVSRLGVIDGVGTGNNKTSGGDSGQRWLGELLVHGFGLLLVQATSVALLNCHVEQ